MSAQSIGWYEAEIDYIKTQLQTAEEALKQVSQMLAGEYEAHTRTRSQLDRMMVDFEAVIGTRVVR